MLHESLIAQWPPPSGPDLFGNSTPDAHARREMERLVRSAAEQVAHLDTVPATLLINWLLDMVWLAYPGTGMFITDPLRQAVKSLTGSRHAVTDDGRHFLDRRAAVGSAIGAWWATRRRHEPDGLVAVERNVRRPEVAAWVALAAVEPLLSVLTSEMTVSTDDEDMFLWRHYVLPDDPRAGATLDGALDLAVAVLDDLTRSTAVTSRLVNPGRVEVLLWIVRRPYAMLDELVRGFSPDNLPLPRHAAELLRAGADRLRAAVADRWTQLPVRVRHEAATRARRQARRAPTLRTRTRRPTVADAADTGDPIAQRAAADLELDRVATIFPIDDDRLLAADEDSETYRIRRAAARRLGTQLDLPGSIALLDEIGTRPGVWPNYLDDFTSSVGATVVDPTPLLQRLADGPFLGAEGLFAAVTPAHPDVIFNWLTQYLDSEIHVAELAVAAADALPPEAETALLDQIYGAYFTKTVQEPGIGALSQRVDLQRLVQVVAGHLGRCRTRPTDRLERLRFLGQVVQESSLEQILLAMKIVLGSAEQAVRNLPLDPVLGAGLVAVVDRARNVDDDGTDILPVIAAELAGVLGQVTSPGAASQEP